jgi:hypothetical protein
MFWKCVMEIAYAPPVACKATYWFSVLVQPLQVTFSGCEIGLTSRLSAKLSPSSAACKAIPPERCKFCGFGNAHGAVRHNSEQQTRGYRLDQSKTTKPGCKAYVLHFVFANIYPNFWKLSCQSGSLQGTEAAIYGGFGASMPSKAERPRCAHTADGSTILDIAHGRIFTLNSSASKIFQLLERGIPQDRIIEHLVKQTGVSPDIAKADLTEFCESLRGYGLLPTVIRLPLE